MTIPKTITITEKNEAWIQFQIKSGNYGNMSEYIRALIRQDEERERQVEAIRIALIQGENSGISERSPAEIIEAVKKARSGKL